MRATFYTVDELLPGKPGWSVRQFQSVDDAISHYRTLPMSGNRVLGMVDQENAYELIRCMSIFPGDSQGEDVLAADYWTGRITRKYPELKTALDRCREKLKPRYLLEPTRLVPIPGRKLREELQGKLLWRGYGGNYDSAIRSIYVVGTGWISPQDMKKDGPLPLVLSYRVDGQTREGEYLDLELEPWEYRRLLEYTKNYYKNK